MIVYFSGTGNSYDAARIIARETGDGLVDLGACYKRGAFDLPVRQGEELGIVFPVYRWSTPRIIDEFLRKVRFVVEGDGDGRKDKGAGEGKGTGKGKGGDDGESEGGMLSSPRRFRPAYRYAVEVFGYFTGGEMDFLERLLRREHGFGFDATFALPSVPNCIYVSNPPKPAKQASLIEREEQMAAQLAKRIAAHECIHEAKGNPIGRLLSKATGTESKERSVRPFNVNGQRCVKCGRCAELCPTNTIAMSADGPLWQGGDCTECLACVHRCPQGAIEYGKISVGRRRYVNPAL